jgi:hypothetical protein
MNSLFTKPRAEIRSPPTRSGAMTLVRLTPLARMAMISLCRERLPRDSSVAMSVAMGSDMEIMLGMLYRKKAATWKIVALNLMSLSALCRNSTQR